MKRIKKEALAALDEATDYRSWQQASAVLDELDGAAQWRLQDSSDDYDWRLIRSRLSQIQRLRETGDITGLLYHLRQGLYWNIGNIANPALYDVARVGTKKLIGDYVDAVCDALGVIEQADALSLDERLQFFGDVSLSFGRSALMLSGGASFGLFHVGVVRALVREGLLPGVLSGSSSGAIVAARIGTLKPEELHLLLEAEAAYYEFWKLLPMTQMLRRRAMMDQAQLRAAVARNIPDLTFAEAYRRSGVAINVTVSPAEPNQSPRLLNHLTFPHLYVREAVLASCAVPLLFPPVMLMTRNEHGQREAYMPQLRWADGSLESDLPVMRMRRLHNVNHFIVSQTNPHVLPFVTRRDPGGFSLRHAVSEYVYASAAGQAEVMARMLGRTLPLRRLRRPFELFSSVLNQEYKGNINVFPRFRPTSYVSLVRNPTLAAVKRFLMEGERAAWSRMEMIRVQTAISLCLQRSHEQLLARLESTVGSQPESPLAKRPALRMVRSRKPRPQ